jgi:hypothetical protein
VRKAEAPGFNQPQALAKLGVVAEFGMGIERQMTGEQVELVRDEQRNARAGRKPARRESSPLLCRNNHGAPR